MDCRASRVGGGVKPEVESSENVEATSYKKEHRLPVPGGTLHNQKQADILEQNLKYPIPTAPAPTKFALRSPRGANLATRVWPAPRPKALCLLVHGGGGHSGYFDGLAEVLNKGNVFCASYDQVSCGYSDAEFGTPVPGVIHVRNFDCFVEDVVAAIRWMQKEAGQTDLPIVLFGESFGALQVLETAFEKDMYDVRVDGVVVSGGLLKLGSQFLPPAPVVSFLIFLAKYYPKIVMPATDFESSFDAAFGDKEWARTSRADPRFAKAMKPTVGTVAATLGTGSVIRSKAKEFPVPLYAVHGRRDVRTSCETMEEFVDKVGPRASMNVIDTDGHQLLQDDPVIARAVMEDIRAWIDMTIAT